MSRNPTCFLDLVTKSGELIRIVCPSTFEDELHETVENALKIRDWWSPSQFDGCSANYLGHRLDRVNMGEIIGTL